MRTGVASPRPGGEEGKDLGRLPKDAVPWEKRGRFLTFSTLLAAREPLLPQGGRTSNSNY